MKHLALLAALVPSWSLAASLHWGDIRDGSLYLLPERTDELRIQWRPAWQADANGEHLYLLDGQGRLSAERAIRAEQVRGEQTWSLEPSAGPYRLEIPGYSFRGYQVEHLDTTRALFAPAKVHFSAEVASGTSLFFRVKAGEQASLAGKYHGGVSRLLAQRLGDGYKVEVALAPYPAYWQFDQHKLPLSTRDETWRLYLQGSGKAAFWLDGTANLFAQRAEHLGDLPLAQGLVALKVAERTVGPTPRLGVAMHYVAPPPSSFAALDALRPQAAGFTASSTFWCASRTMKTPGDACTRSASPSPRTSPCWPAPAGAPCWQPMRPPATACRPGLQRPPGSAARVCTT